MNQITLIGHFKMMQQAEDTDQVIVAGRNGKGAHISLDPVDRANPLSRCGIRFGIGSDDPMVTGAVKQIWNELEAVPLEHVCGVEDKHEIER